MIDFSMAETILYLDAYPENADAMKYYKTLKDEREKLISEMNAQGCPPITAQSAAGASSTLSAIRRRSC